MLIDIDKIVVGENRLRKDFGDLNELAEDIKKNGLINPPTINKNYVLLAGERRLRACKLLGWTQIEVHMLDTKDEAHDLDVEISENNMRQDFTYSELADGIRRQLAIESEKARERMAEGGRGANICTPSGKARNAAAKPFGISGEQARQVLFVDDNKDLLDPADFADWDEGKLSTNKAYKKIKAALEQAKAERDAAEADAESSRRAQKELEDEIAYLKNQPAPEPEVREVVKEVEVVREVVPKDYEFMRSRVDELEHRCDIVTSTNKELRNQVSKKDAELSKKDAELSKAREILGTNKNMQDVRRDVQYLITATNSYIRQYGGLTWTVQQLAQVDKTTLGDLKKAVTNLATFSSALVSSISDMNL